MFIQFSVHFSFIYLTAKFHTIHEHYHAKTSNAKIANIIDLVSFRKLSYYSNFETRYLIVLELMENIFGRAPTNPVNIEPSIINENGSRFNVVSDVDFTLNSPFVPCILSSVNVRPTCAIKLYCDHAMLTWEHVNNLPSRLLTRFTKVPVYAVTHNFANSIQVDMDFHHC